jgi:hypothetical protein
MGLDRITLRRNLVGRRLLSARLHRDLTIIQPAERTCIDASEIEVIVAGL